MKTYRWQCPNGHQTNNSRFNPLDPNLTMEPPSCCPSCGWAPDEGGEWTDLAPPAEIASR